MKWTDRLAVATLTATITALLLLASPVGAQPAPCPTPSPLVMKTAETWRPTSRPGYNPVEAMRTTTAAGVRSNPTVQRVGP